MGKELTEMTLQELWELFPIFLVKHDDKWIEFYKEIECVLQKVLRIKSIIFILDIRGTMTNCSSGII